MKLDNLLIILGIFCVKNNSVRSDHNIILPVVMKFYKMREITSINAILCNYSGDVGTYFATRDSYRRRLTSAKIVHIPNLDDAPTMFQSQTYRIGIIFDLSCPSSWDLLQTASNKLLMNTSYVHTLIFDDTIEAALDKLEPMNVQFDSDITIFAEHYEIYDLFRTAETRPVTAVRCGEWNEELEIIYSKPPRWDLDGVTIRATTVIKEFSLEEDGIQKLLDHQYHPEIDTLSRFAIVTQSYLECLCNFNTSVLFRHPVAGASYDGFARPFSLTTWLVMFLFILISSLVLKAIRNSDVVDEPPNEPEYSYSLFSVLAILSLQGSYVSSSRFPTRVLSAILHFFGIMIYSYYGAEVVGFLLSPSPRTLTTVEKLVDSSLDLWVENVSFHINHFESVVGAKATKYYELAIKGPTRDKDKIMDREKALKRVRKGGFALYGSSTEMFQIIQNTFTGPEICSLYTMDMLSLAVAVTIRKKSPYREIYYKALLRFLESGFRDYEGKKWHASKPTCFGAEDTAPVELEATFIAQMIFAGGFLLALTCFLVEKAVTPNRVKLYK